MLFRRKQLQPTPEAESMSVPLSLFVEARILPRIKQCQKPIPLKISRY
jgi:hypothetical protein